MAKIGVSESLIFQFDEHEDKKDKLKERTMLTASPGLLRTLWKLHRVSESREIIASRTNKRVKLSDGKLVVCSGPMFTGKSTHTIGMLTNEALAGRQVLILSSSIDTRYGPESGLKTHNGLQLSQGNHPNIKIHPIDPDGISKFLNNELSLPIGGVDVIGIDEFQFEKLSDAEIVKFIFFVVDVWKMKLMLSGFNIWANGRPAKWIQLVMAMGVEKVKILPAICEICNKHNAIKTLFRSDYNKMIEGNFTMQDLHVPATTQPGGRAGYIPICRHCLMKAASMNEKEGTNEYYSNMMERLYPFISM